MNVFLWVAALRIVAAGLTSASSSQTSYSHGAGAPAKPHGGRCNEHPVGHGASLLEHGGRAGREHRLSEILPVAPPDGRGQVR